MAIIEQARSLFEIVENIETINFAIRSDSSGAAENVIVAYMADDSSPCIRSLQYLASHIERSDSIPRQLLQRNIRLLYVDVSNESLMSQTPHRVRDVPTLYAHIQGNRKIGRFVGQFDAHKFFELLKKWYGEVILPSYGPFH